MQDTGYAIDDAKGFYVSILKRLPYLTRNVHFDYLLEISTVFTRSSHVVSHLLHRITHHESRIVFIGESLCNIA